MKRNYVVIILCLLINYTVGFPQLIERIVGGSSASIDEAPYQLSLQHRQQHICGAAILTPVIVITAAHCVEGVMPSALSVYAGSTSKDDGGIRIEVSEIIVHKKYNTATSENDIALLKLQQPLLYSSKTTPVLLPLQNENCATGTQATVTGWGYLREDGQVTKYLRKVTVPVITNQKCQYYYRTKAVITGKMLCAGYTEGGRDSCQGDSGGPLVANGKLIGIVSFGYGCGRSGYPGVYTRISKYRNWIDKNLSE